MPADQPAAGAPSLRLLAKRINDAEELLAQMRRAAGIAHGSVVAGRLDEARQVLERMLRAADAYGRR